MPAWLYNKLNTTYFWYNYYQENPLIIVKSINFILEWTKIIIQKNSLIAHHPFRINLIPSIYLPSHFAGVLPSIFDILINDVITFTHHCHCTNTSDNHPQSTLKVGHPTSDNQKLPDMVSPAEFSPHLPHTLMLCPCGKWHRLEDTHIITSHMTCIESSSEIPNVPK